jgi:hypothetical protein
MSLFKNISIFLNNDASQRYTVNSPSGHRMDFVFRYKYVDSSWRAYIVSSPSYGYRSDDMHSTHRHYDANRRLYFVCWTQPITKYDDAVTVSKMWADGTARYIDTGILFG